MNYFRFTTSLANDAVWVGDDNVRPAGLNVAHALCSMLAPGHLAFGSLFQRSHYGWEFDICTMGSPSFRICVCVLTSHFDSFLLAVDRRRSVLDWFSPSAPPHSYEDAITCIRKFLDASPEFSNVVEFDESELAKIEAEASKMERDA